MIRKYLQGRTVKSIIYSGGTRYARDIDLYLDNDTILEIKSALDISVEGIVPRMEYYLLDKDGKEIS